jgi:hypothetical protein
LFIAAIVLPKQNGKRDDYTNLMILKVCVNLQVHFDSLDSTAFIFKIENSGHERESRLSAVIAFMPTGNDMRDWYVGQKIVCVNAGPIASLRNRFVDQHLREGKVYKIRQILVFKYTYNNKSEERVAFRLDGIVPHLINGIEYAFFHGRFRPLEPSDDDEEINISVFLDDLRKVNSGLIQFPAGETVEREPVEGV